MIHSLRVVGTSFDCRQQRIAALEANAPVYFKPEPGNKYDPLAIAVVNEAGEHLGYVPQYADAQRTILNKQREHIRTALANGFVVARANKTGGFEKRDGSRASYGLAVQFYAVSAMYGYSGGKDEEEENIVLKRSNSAQKPKSYAVAFKYKDKEFLRYLDHEQYLFEQGYRQKQNAKRRRLFKAGVDLPRKWLDAKYQADRHFDHNNYWTEEEAKELFMERRAG